MVSDESTYTRKSTFATLPRTTRGMPMVLGGDPKGKNFLYCNGTSVIIRDIDNPAICDIYTQHSQQTTVAKYSPSGFYIASGDNSGKLRIWDTTQSTHILKSEYHFINGPLRDIAWSPDSQRIAVVGEGKERFGHVFLFDTGTSNGQMSGQGKHINSVDFRPTRPMRIVTASEDYTVAIFEGPPFKFKNYFQKHTRFAQCVRYNPDGTMFASCGQDGRIFLFEGDEGTPIGEIADGSQPAHSGGVYALCWSPDGKSILTASGDKSCKLWDVESKSRKVHFEMGSTIDDQQLSCLWQGDHMLSISLSGFVNYLDENNPTKPRQILKGHNRPITALAVAQADEQGPQRIFTGDGGGFISYWDPETGMADRLVDGHKTQVQSMQVSSYGGGQLVSACMGDKVRHTNLASLTGLNAEGLKLDSQPRGLATCQDGSFTVVACQRQILILRGTEPFITHPINYEATCAAMHPVNRCVAVGGEDNKVRIYQLSGESLAEMKTLTHNGAVTAVAYSPDGNHMAACDAARKVVPYKLPDYEVATPKEWSFHTARVNTLAWSPDNRHMASGSLDTNIIVWDVEKPTEYPVIIKAAHAMSQITALDWTSPDVLVSTGQDSNLKQWTIHYA